MRKLFGLSKSTCIVALLIVSVVATVFSQDSTPLSQNVSPLAAPTGAVNDYAGVIDEANKQQLETKLKNLKDKDGTEIAIAVVRTTGERAIFDYSLAVARGWGIGSKEDDNPSALLLVAIDDRKYFTQVSKDLEDELPDGLVGSLQRQFLIPEFRKQNYAKGIADTVDAYIRSIEERRSGIAAPTATPRQGRERASGSRSLYTAFCCLVIIGIILLIIFSNRGGGKRRDDDDGWGGGGFGGAAGALPWIIGSAIGSSIGSGGSSSSSSDWGSGGSDWGGFGGGGDFGGGGAGGDW